jgi:hypothetical protein
MFPHNSPQRFPTASKLPLVSLALVLVTAWLCAVGCAGPQVYVPFERITQESAATRWQSLESLAKRDQWNVVLADLKSYTMVAYVNPAGTSGIRDRIRVDLFSDRTVVETQTEIEDQGLWQASAGRCESYAFSREKSLAEQIQNTPASPTVPRKSTALAAR